MTVRISCMPARSAAESTDTVQADNMEEISEAKTALGTETVRLPQTSRCSDL